MTETAHTVAIIQTLYYTVPHKRQHANRPIRFVYMTTSKHQPASDGNGVKGATSGTDNHD